jgi:hypothetical protein
MLSPHQASPWYMAALQQVSKSTSPMFLRSSLGFFFFWFSFYPMAAATAASMDPASTLSIYSTSFSHAIPHEQTHESSSCCCYGSCLHFVDFPTLPFSHTIPHEQTLESPGCCCYGSCLHFVDFPCFLSDIQLFTSRHMNPQAPL